jgi:two-component system sensor histidine kinase TctE
LTSSISRQLVFWLAVPLTLLALCGALFHYVNTVAPQVMSADSKLRDAAVELVPRIAGDPVTGSQSAPPDHSLRFAIRDAAHTLLEGDPGLPPAPDGEEGKAVFSTVRIDRLNWRVLALRTATPRGPLGIVLATELKAESPAARIGFMSTLLWDFVQLDVTLVLIWLGIRLGLRPVRRLRDEIAQRSPLDLRPIADTGVPSELAPLTATVNRLFVMLRTAVQSQQQFIANTAHQLRTPITGILAQLDLLAADPAAAPIKQRLATLQEGVRQLSHASNQLLTLARADPAVNVAAKNQALSLNALAGETVAKFFDRALQSEIDLGAELDPAEVLADPSLIDDLLNNLVDNALKYTPAGGRVTVSVGLADAHPFVAVEDTGYGIPPAERQRVRQRFYRLPDSPGHGSGLGLAIVEEIAGLYGAELLIESGANQAGTRVCVRFPAAPATPAAAAAHAPHAAPAA